MYSLFHYGKMFTNQGRMEPYISALKNAVEPGGVVVDVGAGTGIFAFLACSFGARHVYAIEPDDAIHVARQIARANGLQDRITFFQDLSTEVSLPEPADVMVSDLRGALPLFAKHVPSIADARRRLLAPGGVMIPRRDRLWVSLVEAPDFYAECVAPWVDHSYGLNMDVAKRLALNTWYTDRKVSHAQLLTDPRCWASVDYTVVESPDVRSTVTVVVERPGTGHGLSIWFDAVLAPGIGFCNEPGRSVATYGHQNFFPWLAPVELAAGDRVEVTLRADLVGEDYIWSWETTVRAEKDPSVVRAHFRQSTFFADLLSPEHLHRQAGDYQPRLTVAGKEAGLILERMAQGIALSNIAAELMDVFPDRFSAMAEALTRVSRFSQLYCE